GKHSCLHRSPTVHNHRVCESQCLVPESCCGGVSGEVLGALLLALVIRATICFDDQSIADYEINLSDSADADLAAHRNAQAVHAQPEQGFESAVGIGSCEVNEPASASREPGPEPGDTRRRDQL